MIAKPLKCDFSNLKFSDLQSNSFPCNVTVVVVFLALHLCLAWATPTKTLSPLVENIVCLCGAILLKETFIPQFCLFLSFSYSRPPLFALFIAQFLPSQLKQFTPYQCFFLNTTSFQNYIFQYTKPACFRFAFCYCCCRPLFD